MNIKKTIKYLFIGLLVLGVFIYAIIFNRNLRPYNKKEQLIKHAEDFFEDSPIISPNYPIGQ